MSDYWGDEEGEEEEEERKQLVMKDAEMKGKSDMMARVKC